MSATLYERDFYAWTQQQTQLLKSGRFSDVDLAHLIEEVESMGIRERRELLSRMRMIVLHLLKWQFQPQLRSSGWRGTLVGQRVELDDLLNQSPSLRSLCSDALEHAYPHAQVEAAAETGLPLSTFAESCPYTLDDVLRLDYFPNDDA